MTEPLTGLDEAIEALAADIRRIDGSHSLGAGALAERLIEAGWRREAEPEPAPKFIRVDKRDPDCVKAWPGCYSFGYDPACCRFPKSCSAGGVDYIAVDETDQAMTAPFDRWRALYRHRPGQLPTREKLDSLAPETLVTVRADVLLQLVVQAENHEAPCEHDSAIEADWFAAREEARQAEWFKGLRT